MSLDRYGKLLKKIGSGTYGNVFLYKKDGVKYAIKWQNYSQEAIIETAVLKALNHPNIIKLDDVLFDTRDEDAEDWKLGLVMKYAKYGTPLPLKQPCKKDKLSLIYQLLCGVAYLHSQDIQHRDLKPQNLLIFKGCKLKITDFGTADALRCARKGKTLSTPVGSLWYRPPELLLGSQYHTSSSDMWAVGLIIFEILTGKPFVEGDSEMDVYYNIIKRLGKFTLALYPKADSLPNYKQFSKFLAKHPPTYDLDPFKDVSPKWKDILKSLLVYNPEKRKTAYDILRNHIFDDVRVPKNEYPPRGCIENLNSRKPKFGTNVPSPIPVIMVKNLLFRLLFHENPETFLFACQLYDIVLSKGDVQLSDLEDYGSACLIITTELKEFHPWSVGDVAYMTNSSESAINLSLIDTLKRVQFHLILSCPFDYIKLYGSQYPSKVEDLALQISTLLVFLEEKDRKDPEHQGFMCIILACMHYGEKVLHSSLLTKGQLKAMSSICGNTLDEAPDIVKSFTQKVGLSPSKFLAQTIQKDLLVS